MVAKQRIADVLEHIVTELFGRKEPDEYYKDEYERDKRLFDYDFVLQQLARIDEENGTSFKSHMKFLKNKFYEIDEYMLGKPVGMNAAIIAVNYFNELGSLVSEFGKYPEICKKEGRYIIATLFENMRYCSEKLWLDEYANNLPKCMSDFEKDFVR